MIGVIDVGGGLRGSYGAGVLDWCMMHDIHFDYGIGVSAGSANIASYAGHQIGRNYIFYTQYFTRWQYMGFKNMFRTGDYVGLDYIYNTLSNEGGEYPLNWKGIMDNPMQYWTVATNALTGKPAYFDKTAMSQDHYDVIKASCCVPVVDKPYMIDDVPYYDGGISDPVPLQKAFDDGCDKVVLILTRPRDFRRIPKNDALLARILECTYPNAAKDMATRSHVYNDCVDKAEELEKEGKILIVAPSDIGHMKTLTKDKESIAALYMKGFEDAKSISAFIK
ncbi:MAG: patatin family protein [Erysipelotrichaceae bacterium]|nr:patatin family protein [Erysipelotrichaceae bacterium]